MRKVLLSLGIATVLITFSGCNASKEEKGEKELAVQEPLATAVNQNDGPRIIHTKRFQQEPVIRRSEKPGLTGLIAINESSFVECVDIHTLSDGTTRHEDCGSYHEFWRQQNPASGVFTGSYIDARPLVGFSHGTGGGIDMGAALRHRRAVLRHKS